MYGSNSCICIIIPYSLSFIYTCAYTVTVVVWNKLLHLQYVVRVSLQKCIADKEHDTVFFPYSFNSYINHFPCCNSFIFICEALTNS